MSDDIFIIIETCVDPLENRDCLKDHIVGYVGTEEAKNIVDAGGFLKDMK